MSIERMTMVNLIAPIEILDTVAKNVVLSRTLHPINAMEQINSNNFSIGATEDNLETIIDINYVRPYYKQIDYSDLDNKMKDLKNIIGEQIEIMDDEKLIFDYYTLEKNTNKIVDKLKYLHEQLKNLDSKKNLLVNYKNNLSYLYGLKINLYSVMNLKNFNMNIYKIKKEKFIKLKSNYENVPAIVKSVYKDKEFNIIIVFSTEVLKTETNRIFNSLNCKDIMLPSEYKGTPSEIAKVIDNEIKQINDSITKIKNNIEKICYENKNEINILRKSFELEQSADRLKEYVACTRDFFYMFGWVPNSMLNKFKNKFKQYDSEIIIIEKSVDTVQKNIRVPTKLRNNLVIKPFETMVNMYGVPSYEEIDPTSFLAITYMIMFGAMFGDIGQGLVLLALGVYLRSKKKKITIGNILVRLGVSSSVFGLLYGSIFGFEDVIEPILVRPMENISKILLGAIVFGCGLLIIGYLFGLVNNIRRGNLEDGIFGKDGLVGLIFYTLLLVFGVTKIKTINIISTKVWVIIFTILLFLMVLKQPLANLIKKERPLFRENKLDYFIEGGFGVIETLLSMFSNTISFIRVGAFALNHVGLFIAFASMAQMMKNGVGSVFMYVLGNIIIICLEGLIVFIQGLRLEYYELFSKYYDGSGLQFNPIGINNEGN